MVLTSLRLSLFLSVGLAPCWCIAQMLAPGTQIRTDIRPIVTMQYSGGAGVAVGILDTGDSRETFSRETARLLGIGVTTPIDTNALGNQIVYNYGTTAAQNITAGGWFGATLNGPERVTAAGAFADPQVRAGDPAHLFTLANVAATATRVSNGLQPFYRDYNGRFSENHNGSTFLSQANPANNLVAMIDPINATPLPFSYDNTTAGNGRNLAGAGNPLDRLASSVSYFANNHPQVPVRGRNDNPGFVTFVDPTPMEFASSTPMTPRPGDAVVNAALPAGVDRRLTITVAAADAANANVLIPANVANNPPQNPNGFLPTYRPADAALATAAPAYGYLMEVRNNTINIGGQENANGFVRADGALQVVVRSNAPGNPVLFTQTVQLPSQAPRPFGTINIPALGINTGPTALIDTGAPDTTAGTIVGTDVLNRFGQYFDYSPRGNAANPNRGLLTLVGPTQPEVRAALGNGMLFTVDQGTAGLERTAVNFTSAVGSVPQVTSGPGGNTLTTDGVPQQAAQTIFRCNMTGSNAAYTAPSALGLAAGAGGQVISGMSLGGDAFGPNSPVYFGVGRGASGLAGTGVTQQVSLNQSAADIFLSNARPAPGAPNPADPLAPQRVAGTNTLFVNQEVLGLGQNCGPAFAAAANNDNMRDFKLFTQRALPNESLSNMDSPIRQPNEAAPASRPRVGTDRLANTFDVYFSVQGRDNIYVDDVNHVFATNQQMGLVTGDRINALALYRPSVHPGVPGLPTLQPGTQDSPDSFDFDVFGQQRFDPTSFLGIDLFNGHDSDLAMFTLAPGSPTLSAFDSPLSAADLFITDFDQTFALYSTAERMGLHFNDVIDGLSPLPEPALGLLLVCASVLVARRARR